MRTTARSYAALIQDGSGCLRRIGQDLRYLLDNYLLPEDDFDRLTSLMAWAHVQNAAAWQPHPETRQYIMAAMHEDNAGLSGPNQSTLFSGGTNDQGAPDELA